MPATPAPALTPTNASSNPFANTSFASTVTAPAAAANPFSAVSFASTPVNATKPLGFASRGPFATSTKKLRRAQNTVSTIAAADTKALPPLRPGAKENEVIPMDEATKLNLTMLRMAQKEAKSNPLSDYTPWLKNYIAQSKVLEEGANGNGNGTANGTGSQETKPVQPTTFGSNFALSPAPKTSESDATTSSSTPTFSFKNPAPAPTAEPTKFTGFSFGSPSPAPMPAASAATPTPTSQNEDETQTNNKDDDSETDALAAAVLDEDEEELYFCPAKYTKREGEEGNKTWKPYSTGNLRLYRSKKDGTGKLVVRNNTGIVLLNLAIAKGAPITKVEGSNSKRTGSIQLISVEKDELGPEMFTLVTRIENMDELHKNLQMLAKK